jgi:hypothetical protein
VCGSEENGCHAIKLDPRWKEKKEKEEKKRRAAAAAAAVAKKAAKGGKKEKKGMQSRQSTAAKPTPRRRPKKSAKASVTRSRPTTAKVGTEARLPRTNYKFATVIFPCNTVSHARALWTNFLNDNPVRMFVFMGIRNTETGSAVCYRYDGFYKIVKVRVGKNEMDTAHKMVKDTIYKFELQRAPCDKINPDGVPCTG